MKLKTLLFALVCLFISCEKIDLDQKENSGEINLFDLEVGQVSQFRFFMSFPSYSPRPVYFGDTLILEVLEKEERPDGQGDRFLISESISSGSNVLKPNAGYLETEYRSGTNTQYYLSAVDQGDKSKLLFPTSVDGDLFLHSMLFDFLYFIDKMDIRKFEGKEVQIQEDDFSFIKDVELDSDSYTLDFELKGITYDRLNVHPFGRPGVADSGNFGMLFSEEHGIVRVFERCNGWCSRDYSGWDKINN